MFQVEWLQSALDELATIWVESNLEERNAVTSAAQAVEKRLRINAANEGEGRAEATRVTFIEPLAISFRIEPGTNIVTVARVHRYRPRR